MGEVIELDLTTCLDLPVEKVLDGAAEADLKDLLVIGFTEDGELYFAGTSSNGPENLWLLEMAKHQWMRQFS